MSAVGSSETVSTVISLFFYCIDSVRLIYRIVSGVCVISMEIHRFWVFSVRFFSNANITTATVFIANIYTWRYVRLSPQSPYAILYMIPLSVNLFLANCQVILAPPDVCDPCHAIVCVCFTFSIFYSKAKPLKWFTSITKIKTKNKTKEKNVRPTFLSFLRKIVLLNLILKRKTFFVTFVLI